MFTVPIFLKIVFSFPNVTESPHFDKIAFKVNNKIFATLNKSEGRATIKLTLLDQNVFCVYNNNVMHPVPNKWGNQGWTHIILKNIPKQMCKDALAQAYNQIITKKK